MNLKINFAELAEREGELTVPGVIGELFFDPVQARDDLVVARRF